MFAHAPSMPGALSEHHTHSHGNMLMPHAHAEHHDNAVDEIEHARSHIPAVLVGAPLTWRNLVSLGISGGLLPCPSALVVMLSAIALGRVALGLALIVAFSLGLAGVLILSGLMLLYAGKVALRFLPQGRASSLLFRLVPIGSALLVTLLGIGIAVEAFVQTGLVR
jgi:ABC-type nickel/cobalt efflux system permease component RcnA